MSNDVSRIEMHLSRHNIILAVAIFGTTACGACGACLGFLMALPITLSASFLQPAITTGGIVGFIGGLLNCVLVAIVPSAYRGRVAVTATLLCGALAFGLHWRVAIGVGSV